MNHRNDLKQKLTYSWRSNCSVASVSVEEVALGNGWKWCWPLKMKASFIHLMSVIGISLSGWITIGNSDESLGTRSLNFCHKSTGNVASLRCQGY